MTLIRLLSLALAACALLHLGVAEPVPKAAAKPVAEPAAKADAQYSYSPPSHFSSSHDIPPHFGGSSGGGSPRALHSSSSHSTSRHGGGGGGDKSHCALLIPGHRSSSPSHFEHSFGSSNSIHSNDETVCISFSSIDEAFARSRDKHGLKRPGKEDNAEVRSELGEILQDTTKIIADRYKLPSDVIVNGLPLVDTHKTIIGTVCSDFTRPEPCKKTKYRSVNGKCNNLENPHWGSALTTFKRFLLPEYDDGLSKPREHSKHGYKLPSPRSVSAHIHRDEGLHDHAITIMAVAWGQAIDHDMTLTAETKLPGTTDDPKCCGKDRGFPACFPIEVSEKDKFYSLFKQTCISLTRSRPGLTENCKLGPRTQINEISSYLDANWIYGNDEAIRDRIRLFKGGLLKALPVFREFGLKDMLPLKLENPSSGCIRPNDEVFCFDAGDNRVNEQLVLAVIHTLFMREHNRIVEELSKINPHWDDEKLYQEGRHIVAAILQHITYNEFLPMILGKDMMQKHKIILKKHGYFDGYNPKVDATVTAQFVTASFRFGHSLLPSTVERWSPNHKYIASQRLSEMLRQPYDLYKGGWCDQYIMGLVNQVAQAMDDAISQEVTNHLFQEPNKKFGMDLASINMQRAREHGVPGYNDFREFCGMPRLHSWSDLNDWMSNKTVNRYRDIYRHVDDIDLWSGGVSERPLPGSMVGPTYSCLIGLSFKDLRYGDRYWYENPNQPSSFSPHQLEEIRKIKLSRIICDNSDDIHKMQVYAMVLPDHEINPRVSCKSGVLPRIDLSKWAEKRSHGSKHVGDDGYLYSDDSLFNDIDKMLSLFRQSTEFEDY